MGKQRLAGDPVQHLRTRRTHAGTLAGREHDGKAGAFTHHGLLSGAHPAPGALISECAAPEKAECASKPWEKPCRSLPGQPRAAELSASLPPREGAPSALPAANGCPDRKLAA